MKKRVKHHKNENLYSDHYKGRYEIVFYDSDDETYIMSFSTINQLCKHKQLEITPTNTNMIRVELYRALKKKDHSTRMLNGSLMHVYLVDMIDDED